MSDSTVPVAKIDTACKSNISIFSRKITKMLVLTWENSRLKDLILILHVISSSSVRPPVFQYQLFAVHVLQEIVIINFKLRFTSQHHLSATDDVHIFLFFVKFCYKSIILMVSMCVCIILVFVNKQAFSRWGFPNMGIEGVCLARLTSTKIIYYNRYIQHNDIFTIWIVNKYIC